MVNKLLTKLSHKFGIDFHYFGKGGFWLTLLQAITVLGSLLVSVVFANTLEETEFGVYRYILGIGLILTSFSLTGMGQSILQTAAQGHKWFYDVATKKSLIYSLGISAASLIGSIYYYLQGNTELALGCLLIALFQPVINTFQQIFPFLQGSKDFRESTVLQGIKTVIVTLSSLIGVLLTQNVIVLVFIYLFSNAITNLSMHLYARPKVELGFEEVVNTRYTKYAWNTSIRNIIGNIAFRIDSIIVFQQLGAAELAIYSIANIIPEHIKGSFKNIATLLIPKYTLHENIDSLKKGMFKRSIQLFLVFAIITLIYLILAPLIYTLLFPKYEDAIFLSQILALSFPAMIALIPLSALQAHTEEKRLTLLNTKSSVAMILLTIFCTITYGLVGAILARVFSRYITLILTYYFFYSKKRW